MDVDRPDLACGFARNFACKTPQIVKSSRFKSGEYGSQAAGVWNSTNSHWTVLAVLTDAESKISIFQQDTSSGPRRIHAVSKALGRHWR
jgi:hypothetical protein